MYGRRNGFWDRAERCMGSSHCLLKVDGARIDGEGCEDVGNHAAGWVGRFALSVPEELIQV